MAQTSSLFRRFLIGMPAGMLVVLAASAAGPPDQAQVQQTLEKAKLAQTCMQHVDKSAVEKVRRQSEAVHKQVQALCASGKRAEARTMMMTYAKRMASDPTVAAMRKCGLSMHGELAHLQGAHAQASGEAQERRDICNQK